MPNHLAGTNSPYLLQHADNPVDWYPWGPEALEKAKSEEKPILLSIGYAACHWCHVMAHESFEDPEIAAIMNEHFVSIKVDREEHPDLDNLYMSAVVAMVGQGGWPLNVFLTPQGQPFYGGTYFPPVPRYNIPSFRDVLLSVARIWKDDRAGLLRSSDQISLYLAKINLIKSGEFKPRPEIIEQAANSLIQSYDWKGGGWGQAPKFPQSMAIEFLLLLSSQGNQPALDVACHALSSMARGGMYDIVGGGFSRYSTDNQWLIPHFEKMLYDNAQLARVYLQAYLITGDSFYRNICEATLDFVHREMTNELGGFYSSIDADSEGEEGKYYLWSEEEISAAIDNDFDFKFYLTAFQITKEGNFAGKNVIRRTLDDGQLAEIYHLNIADVREKISQLNQKLLKAREKRVRPGTDDKSLTIWNALMLQAFAEAARYLNRDDYLSIAVRNGEFIINSLCQDGILYRAWRNGSGSLAAFLEDYAALILGLLALYQSDPDVRWFETALGLMDQVSEHFVDPDGGFFDTKDDQPAILVRPKELSDNATPSGNALACVALQMLYAYQGEQRYIEKAYDCLGFVFNEVSYNKNVICKWLCALSYYLHSFDEIAILGNILHPNTQEMISNLWSTFRPTTILSVADYPPPTGSPELIKDRPLLNDLPTAYVCRNFQCNQPTNDPSSFSAQLNP